VCRSICLKCQSTFALRERVEFAILSAVRPRARGFIFDHFDHQSGLSLVSTTSSSSSSTIRARKITASDIESIASLLARGFKRRPRQYWLRALERLSVHPTPTGFPKYGYLLECDGVPVGVILLIFSMIPGGDVPMPRCNVSSWYVEPAFRGYAPLFISQALKDKTATYLNISPASHVQPIIKAQGFTRYSSGQFVTFPTLSRMPNDNPRTVLGTDVNRPGAAFEPFERELLLRHSEYGCISLWCRTADRAYPFVFLPRIVKGCVPCVQLIYCRAIEDFVRFSGTIGRFLLLRGRPLVIIDSTGPIVGLFGKYFEGAAPKYFRGPEPPRLGDLAYTEAPMFGL
jgi:hypothetical protein